MTVTSLARPQVVDNSSLANANLVLDDSGPDNQIPVVELASTNNATIDHQTLASTTCLNSECPSIKDTTISAKGKTSDDLKQKQQFQGHDLDSDANLSKKSPTSNDESISSSGESLTLKRLGRRRPAPLNISSSTSAVINLRQVNSNSNNTNNAKRLADNATSQPTPLDLSVKSAGFLTSTTNENNTFSFLGKTLETPRITWQDSNAELASSMHKPALNPLYSSSSTPMSVSMSSINTSVNYHGQRVFNTPLASTVLLAGDATLPMTPVSPMTPVTPLSSTKSSPSSASSSQLLLASSSVAPTAAGIGATATWLQPTANCSEVLSAAFGSNSARHMQQQQQPPTRHLSSSSSSSSLAMLTPNYFRNASYVIDSGTTSAVAAASFFSPDTFAGLASPSPFFAPPQMIQTSSASYSDNAVTKVQASITQSSSAAAATTIQTTSNKDKDFEARQMNKKQTLLKRSACDPNLTTTTTSPRTPAILTSPLAYKSATSEKRQTSSDDATSNAFSWLETPTLLGVGNNITSNSAHDCNSASSIGSGSRQSFVFSFAANNSTPCCAQKNATQIITNNNNTTSANTLNTPKILSSPSLGSGVVQDNSTLLTTSITTTTSKAMTQNGIKAENFCKQMSQQQQRQLSAPRDLAALVTPSSVKQLQQASCCSDENRNPMDVEPSSAAADNDPSADAELQSIIAQENDEPTTLVASNLDSKHAQQQTTPAALQVEWQFVQGQRETPKSTTQSACGPFRVVECAALQSADVDMRTCVARSASSVPTIFVSPTSAPADAANQFSGTSSNLQHQQTPNQLSSYHHQPQQQHLPRQRPASLCCMLTACGSQAAASRTASACGGFAASQHYVAAQSVSCCQLQFAACCGINASATSRCSSSLCTPGSGSQDTLLSESLAKCALHRVGDLGGTCNAKNDSCLSMNGCALQTHPHNQNLHPNPNPNSNSLCNSYQSRLVQSQQHLPSSFEDQQHVQPIGYSHRWPTQHLAPSVASSSTDLHHHQQPQPQPQPQPQQRHQLLLDSKPANYLLTQGQLQSGEQLHLSATTLNACQATDTTTNSSDFAIYRRMPNFGSSLETLPAPKPLLTQLGGSNCTLSQPAAVNKSKSAFSLTTTATVTLSPQTVSVGGCDDDSSDTSHLVSFVSPASTPPSLRTPGRRPLSTEKRCSSAAGSFHTSVSPNQARRFRCSDCVKSFSRSDMLTRHRRLHSGDKPFRCDQCQQEFSRSDHLATHMRTHTGEKPYKCRFCVYTACRKDMITRHLKVHGRMFVRQARHHNHNHLNNNNNTESKLNAFH